MLVDDLSPTALLLLSIITSFGLSAIAYKVFMSKLGTLESILVWYVALAFGIMLAVAIVCMTTQPQSAFYRKTNRTLVDIAGSTPLIVVVFIDRKNSPNRFDTLQARLFRFRT